MLCRIGFVVFEQVASAEAALSASEDELILDGRSHDTHMALT